ncbi:MAG: hypothetical protein ABMA25_18465 [Ilumatobacteraceae bacterium]
MSSLPPPSAPFPSGSPLPPPSPGGQPSSPVAATRSRRGLLVAGAIAVAVALGVGGFLALGGDDTGDGSVSTSAATGHGDADQQLVRVTRDGAVELLADDGTVAVSTSLTPDESLPIPFPGVGRFVAVERDGGILAIIDPVAGTMTELVVGTDSGGRRFGDSMVYFDVLEPSPPLVVDLATASLTAVAPAVGQPGDTRFFEPREGREGAVVLPSETGAARFVDDDATTLWWVEGTVSDAQGDVSLVFADGEQWQLRRLVGAEQVGQRVTVDPFLRGRLVADDRAVLVTASGVITEVNFTDGSQRQLSDLELVDVEFVAITDDRVVLQDADRVRVVMFDGTELAAFEPTDLYGDGESIRTRPVGERCALFEVTGGATERSALIDLSNGAVLAQVPGRLGAYRSSDGCSAIIVTGSGTGLVIDSVVQTLPGDVYALAPNLSQAVLRVDDTFVLYTISTGASVPLGEEFAAYQWVLTG